MIRLVFLVLFVTVHAANPASQAQPLPCPSRVPYGANEQAGHTVTVNGIRLYYETYGKGRPLLLIHGNGGSIGGARCQIPYFSRSYRVIVTDSRAHGRTEDGTGPLTYEQMADDLAAMLRQTNTGPVDIIGQSDGAILGLLLAIHHPALVSKLVAFAPNLRPDNTALVDWFLPSTIKARDDAEAMLAKGDRSQNWSRIKRQNQLMLDEPHIPVADLRRIEAPTLLMGSDEDAITLEHFIEMYRALPKGHLAILPGTTHVALVQKPELFNSTAERFLKEPFNRPTTKAAFGVK
jgi:pimeloyl-ACP methyl ester carboxylesterase